MRMTLDEVLSLSPEATRVLAARVQHMSHDEIRALFDFTLADLLAAIAKTEDDLMHLIMLVHPHKAQA